MYVQLYIVNLKSIIFHSNTQQYTLLTDIPSQIKHNSAPITTKGSYLYSKKDGRQQQSIPIPDR